MKLGERNTFSTMTSATQSYQVTDRLDPMESPFPVVACETLRERGLKVAQDTSGTTHGDSNTVHSGDRWPAASGRPAAGEVSTQEGGSSASEDSPPEGDPPVESFFSPQPPDDLLSWPLDGPACLRPETGRESVAYASFILQNYDSLPDFMYFLHGHDTRYL